MDKQNKNISLIDTSNVSHLIQELRYLDTHILNKIAGEGEYKGKGLLILLDLVIANIKMQGTNIELHSFNTKRHVDIIGRCETNISKSVDHAVEIRKSLNSSYEKFNNFQNKLDLKLESAEATIGLRLDCLFHELQESLQNNLSKKIEEEIGSYISSHIIQLEKIDKAIASSTSKIDLDLILNINKELENMGKVTIEKNKKLSILIYFFIFLSGGIFSSITSYLLF